MKTWFIARGIVLVFCLCTLLGLVSPQSQCKEQQQLRNRSPFLWKQPARWAPAVTSLVRTPSWLQEACRTMPFADPSTPGACSGPNQPDSKTEFGLLLNNPKSKLAPSLKGIRATTVLCPHCILQRSGDSGEVLQPILCNEPYLMRSPEPSCSPQDLLICSEWERRCPLLRNTVPKVSLSGCSSIHESICSQGEGSSFSAFLIVSALWDYGKGVLYDFKWKFAW